MSETHNIELLLGLHISKTFFDAQRETIVLITTTGDKYYITHHSDCCEYVYYAHANQTEDLIDATINKVDELEYEVFDCKTAQTTEPECCDKYGLTIHTNKGSVTIETRMESNGCYSGALSIDKMENEQFFNIQKTLSPLIDF